jgi:Rrf2 family transcriptional regulator, nitric oxide-sensitive transcriptional repressor
MRLTLHTDYALRALIRVAIADGALITISDIAQSFDISKQHLMKVVNDLSRKGYLDTVRGRNGGIWLRQDTLRYQCRPSGARHRRVRCYRLSGAAWLLPDSTSLRAARRVAPRPTHYLAELDAYTLADLIRPRRELSSLLLVDQHAAR